MDRKSTNVTENCSSVEANRTTKKQKFPKSLILNKLPSIQPAHFVVFVRFSLVYNVSFLLFSIDGIDYVRLYPKLLRSLYKCSVHFCSLSRWFRKSPISCFVTIFNQLNKCLSTSSGNRKWAEEEGKMLLACMSSVKVLWFHFYVGKIEKMYIFTFKESLSTCHKHSFKCRSLPNVKQHNKQHKNFMLLNS